MENKRDFLEDVPYEERRCIRCGKHIDELPTLGEVDPEANIEYKEQKLFLRHREQKPPPYDAELEEIISVISERGEEEFPAIQEHYGPDKVAKAIEYEGECGLIWEVLECANCVVQPGYWRRYIGPK